MYNQSNSGRAPFPANNRQIPANLRVNGNNTAFCYGCNKSKPRQAFSETQLKKATSRNPDKKHHILCKECTPAQPDSLKCSRCSKNLSMDCFSKTQRKNQEKATCKKCRELIDADDSEEDFIIDEDPDHSIGDIRDVL